MTASPEKEARLREKIVKQRARDEAKRGLAPNETWKEWAHAGTDKMAINMRCDACGIVARAHFPGVGDDQPRDDFIGIYCAGCCPECREKKSLVFT